MNRDKSDSTTHSLAALVNFRGIFKRVASQLDVDPSYVSRVARGERHAPYIAEALHQELQLTLGKAGLGNGNGHNHNGAGQNHNGTGHNHNGAGPVSLNGRSRNGSADRSRQSGEGQLSPKLAKRTKRKKE